MGVSPDISTLKKQVRKEKLLWRKSLSPDEARSKSLLIAASVRALPEYAAAKCVLFYVSAKANEVDTHALIREALANNVRALVPVTDFDRGALAVAHIRAMEELVPARFGLLEPDPKRARLASPDDADIIIVPGVAFDREGRRVGFGGGYYDRLLSGNGALAVALSYEGQLVDKAPVGAHDVPVDVIVTEQAVYRAATRRR
jgi:5-formyltetrahydrofolate cyclo-ligase